MKTKQEQFLIAIARIEKFSPAPMILARAMKLLRDPQSDVDSIAQLVGRDPSLVADIIRCANSVYYGGGGAAQSIEGAVQKIGFRETISLLNVAVSRVTAGRDLGGYGISADDFWAESLFNGLFLRRLAIASGTVDSDEAYTVGLLRFIGRLAIDQVIHDVGGGVFWQGTESIGEWERQSVGYVQAEAGAILLTKWQFPKEMVDAIAGQEEPARLPQANWLAEALGFASTLFPQGLGLPMHVALTEDQPISEFANDFIRKSGLTPSKVEALIAATREDHDRIRQNFA